MLFAEWRLIFTGAADASVNMAIDEATLILVGSGRVPPTVRVYYWDMPCYTVGYLQAVSDLRSGLQHAEWKCVRRLTGGRACLHGGDLSYSLTVSVADTVIPSNVLDSYERISSGVIEGLRLLGIDARYAPPAEVQVDRHVVATAGQSRRQGVLLHQGTIALAPSALEGKTGLPCRVMTPLSEIIGQKINVDDAAKALGMGLKRALGVDLSPSILFAKEKRLARQLLRDKYLQPEWNWSR